MQQITSVQPIVIVEDNDDDYEATERALIEDGNLRNPIVRCEDGEECLDYLFRRGRFEGQSAPQPGIILLDLNLPGKDGRKVLEEIKSDPVLREIPVVVLTTSEDERDVKKCYLMGANTYVKKPVDLEGFFEAVRRLKEYWFEIAILPRAQR